MTEINKTQAENTASKTKEAMPTQTKKDKNKKATAPLNKEQQQKPSVEKKVKEQDIHPSQPETTKTATSHGAQPKASKSGLGLSLLAISMVLALSGGVYYLDGQRNSQLTAEISALNSQISLLKDEQQEMQTKHQAEVTESKQARNALQTQLIQQDNSLSGLQSALIELRGRRPNDWLLAEADHLIKQAGRQLWIEKDLATTMRLVQTADQRIAQLNDPSLTPIRSALAHDLQKLKSVERVDSDGIVLRIASLQSQVNSLVLANALLAEEVKELAPAEVSEEISNWKENLTTSLKDFADQFITYRKREGSVVPLLTPAQTFYLQENVKAKLAQAINSTYRENTKLYQDSLATAKQWIMDFYNLEMPETLGFIESINELEKLTIKTSYPTELASLALISDELSQRLTRDLTSLVSVTGDQQ